MVYAAGKNSKFPYETQDVLLSRLKVVAVNLGSNNIFKSLSLHNFVLNSYHLNTIERASIPTHNPFNTNKEQIKPSVR